MLRDKDFLNTQNYTLSIIKIKRLLAYLKEIKASYFKNLIKWELYFLEHKDLKKIKLFYFLTIYFQIFWLVILWLLPFWILLFSSWINIESSFVFLFATILVIYLLLRRNKWKLSSRDLLINYSEINEILQSFWKIYFIQDKDKILYYKKFN